jgi:hypothetical protein
VSGGPDETLGLRLGPLFRLPDGNLLGHQTKSLGSKGLFIIEFKSFFKRNLN